MKSHETKESDRNYLLRNIPEKLWRRVKMCAAKNDKTYREIILQALLDYVNKKEV